MLTKVSEKGHEVNQALLWKDPSGQHTQHGEGQSGLNHGMHETAVVPKQVGDDRDLNCHGSCGSGKKSGDQRARKGCTVTGGRLERSLGG